MIRNVVLDIGGVLVDYHTVSFYENRGYDPELSKRLADATMYGPYWEQQDLGLMSSDWIFSKMKEAHPEFSAIIDQNLYDQTGIVTRRAESKAWIEHLRQSGYRVLVLSNFSEPALRDCPDAMDFLGENMGGTGKVGEYGVICEGILSCKVHTVKPYPAIYGILLTRYGLIPEETVFVDDTQKNLTAAQAYGIHTILFRSREQVLEELEGIE